MSMEAEKNQDETFNKTTLPTDNETIQTNKKNDFYNTHKSSKSLEKNNNYRTIRTEPDNSISEASE